MTHIRVRTEPGPDRDPASPGRRATDAVAERALGRRHRRRRPDPAHARRQRGSSCGPRRSEPDRPRAQKWSACGTW